MLFSFVFVDLFNLFYSWLRLVFVLVFLWIAGLGGVVCCLWLVLWFNFFGGLFCWRFFGDCFVIEFGLWFTLMIGVVVTV